jgi:hypothetical protein
MRHCPKHQHFQGLFLKGKEDAEDGPRSRGWKWPPTQNRWTKHTVYTVISSWMILRMVQSELHVNKVSRESIITRDWLWEEFVQSLCPSIYVMKNSYNSVNTNSREYQTFSSFPCQNSKWHVANLIHSLIFKRMWRQNWILSPMTSLLRVSNVNMNGALNAFSPSRTNLMEMINKHISICSDIIQFQHFLVALVDILQSVSEV